MTIALYDSGLLLNPAAVDLALRRYGSVFNYCRVSAGAGDDTRPATLFLYMTGLLALFATRNKCAFRKRTSMGVAGLFLPTTPGRACDLSVSETCGGV